MMACINDVYDPSLEYYTFHTTLLPPNKDIIGIDKVEQMARRGILEGLRNHVELYNRLPECFVILRSGVDTGQIPMVQTKEIGMMFIPSLCIAISFHVIAVNSWYQERDVSDHEQSAESTGIWQIRNTG